MRARLITHPPSREQIMALDHDGNGVDRLEFIVGMMMRAPPTAHHSHPPPPPPSPRLGWNPASLHCVFGTDCGAVLGVELCGQPLEWNMLRPFLIKFEKFDVSKTGRLSHDDLEKYVEAVDAIETANKKYSAHKKQWISATSAARLPQVRTSESESWNKAIIRSRLGGWAGRARVKVKEAGKHTRTASPAAS
jgi:hypothetical protein